MGFNGTPEGFAHCETCPRDGMPTGQHPELCRAVHAEQNAIINASRLGVSTEGATLYVTGKPCILCTKMLINAGVDIVNYTNKVMRLEVLLKEYLEGLK
uniref:Putative CMP/dCMP deaminase zinc-binding n=1 Tax=viral metagenome TaxID=1070528 RepID=A0A6M3IQ50_9ZZZZ